MDLEALVIERIGREGPMSFRDFMDMALYYPGMGFYDSPAERIGKNGDFVTSPSLSPLFGSMVAGQLQEMRLLLKKEEFYVIEYGAGNGLLCRSILDQFHPQGPDAPFHYCIIERSEASREKAKKVVPEQVRWLNDISELGPFCGCVLSNELLDNFPVHRVLMQDELMEVFVGYENGFVEMLRPAGKELKDYLAELNISLSSGFRTEINLEACAWLREASAYLQKGFLLTFDYGYPSTLLYEEGRRGGTLVCYQKHGVNDCPYRDIGEQDITSHVNFSALRHWGSLCGLSFTGFTNQAYFLMGLGLSSFARKNGLSDRHIRMMPVLLSGLGTKIKLLVQHKGIEDPRLSGLRFAERLA